MTDILAICAEHGWPVPPEDAVEFAPLAFDWPASNPDATTTDAPAAFRWRFRPVTGEPPRFMAYEWVAPAKRKGKGACGVVGGHYSLVSPERRGELASGLLPLRAAVGQ